MEDCARQEMACAGLLIGGWTMGGIHGVHRLYCALALGY